MRTNEEPLLGRTASDMGSWTKARERKSTRWRTKYLRYNVLIVVIGAGGRTSGTTSPVRLYCRIVDELVDLTRILCEFLDTVGHKRAASM